MLALTGYTIQTANDDGDPRHPTRRCHRNEACAGATAFLLYALRERGYFWLVVMVTPTALLMLSAVDFEGDTVAFDRVSNSLIGIVIGLAFAEVARLGTSLCDRVPIAPNAVITLDVNDLAARSVGRHAERVPLSLHDQDGDAHRIQLGEPRLLGPTRRMNGESETENPYGVRVLRRPARDPCPEGATTPDE